MKLWVKVLVLMTAILLIGTVGLVEAKPKVVGIASLHQNNDWNVQIAEAAKKVLEEKGYEVIHTNAQGNTAQQVAAVENFLARKVDGVIIPGGEAPAFFPVIAKLKKAGIPVVGVEIPSSDVVTNITSDNYNGAELLALFALNKLGGKAGEVVFMSVPGWHSVDIRDNVAKLIFEMEPGLKFITKFDNGQQDPVNRGMTQVQSLLLSHPNLKVVYSSWGLGALGAVRAIRAAGLQKKIFVVATDADRAVLTEMASPDSPIAAVIAQVPLKEGELAAKYMIQAIEGDVETIPPTSYAPIYFVTKEPWFAPPSADTVTPQEAWKIVYPGSPFGH